jgi:hypothetical protein
MDCGESWYDLTINNQTGENKMKHHKYHQHYQVKAAKLHARAEAALDLITALVIGIGLAAALFYGWSA